MTKNKLITIKATEKNQDKARRRKLTNFVNILLELTWENYQKALKFTKELLEGQKDGR